MDRWASLAGRYSGATAEKAVPFPRVACRSKGISEAARLRKLPRALWELLEFGLFAQCGSR